MLTLGHPSIQVSFISVPEWSGGGGDCNPVLPLPPESLCLGQSCRWRMAVHTDCLEGSRTLVLVWSHFQTYACEPWIQK